MKNSSRFIIKPEFIEELLAGSVVDAYGVYVENTGSPFNLRGFEDAFNELKEEFEYQIRHATFSGKTVHLEKFTFGPESLTEEAIERIKTGGDYLTSEDFTEGFIDFNWKNCKFIELFDPRRREWLRFEDNKTGFGSEYCEYQERGEPDDSDLEYLARLDGYDFIEKIPLEISSICYNGEFLKAWALMKIFLDEEGHDQDIDFCYCLDKVKIYEYFNK